MKIFNIILSNLLRIFKINYLLEIESLKRNEGKIISPLTNHFIGFIESGMKIIDVGANVGNYSKVFIDLGATVLAIEPQTYCQHILEKRFKNYPNFRLLKTAVGSEPGVALIHKPHSHTIASMNLKWIEEVKKTNRFENEDWTNKETIFVVTLDSVIKTNFVPDYIKIDVEGFETEVLKGLSYPVKNISFEITLPEFKDAAVECINLIDRVGNYLYCIPENTISTISNWMTKKEMLDEIETLSSKKVSSDIFCRLNNE